MKFGLHHSSWLEIPDPAETYEAVKAKAQWAEEQSINNQRPFSDMTGRG